MKTLSAIFLITILLSGCNPKGRIYSKHKELSKDLEWLKKDVIKFNAPIDDNSLSYNLSLSFRYAYGYQFNIMKVSVTEISPSGKQITNNYDLIIKAENGDYIGDPGYDIWDSEHLIVENKHYDEVGVYKYIIEHNMPNDPVNFAMEIGLIIDEVPF